MLVDAYRGLPGYANESDHWDLEKLMCSDLFEVNVNITNWKITIFNGKIWKTSLDIAIFNSYVELPEATVWIFFYRFGD